ncbi:hypothetical protein CALCODRAFT_484862 [Calocera cornea HHB12733]|uniref:Uncharacterized protein n=1 Tax=Calocera cornea HHB12733 TaxID=1353952 RepID=A0A165EQ33_9BASI|nr:hypothetical protein CALCODRAFT_484862 [Calocera cornea HHB12733]
MASAYFQTRNERGVYTKLMTALEVDPSHSLVDPDSMKGVILWKHQNTESIDWCEHSESTGNLVAKQFVLAGEVGPPEEGTVWGARGRITDRTSVKNRVAIHVPSAAPEDLINMFHDQEYNLSQQIIAGEGGMKKAEAAMARSRDRKGYLNTWLEPSAHVIYLTTESLYTKHIGETRGDRRGGAGGSAELAAFTNLTPSNRKKRRGRTASDESSGGEGDGTGAGVGATQPEVVEDIYAAHGEGLDATYSLNVLPDHSGEQFQQVLARVKQQPFYRMDGTLVKPWEHATVFRQGTLVLAVVTLTRWVIGGNTTYQLQLVSLREVDGSPYPEPGGRTSPTPGAIRSAQSTPMRIQRGTEIDLSRLLDGPGSPTPTARLLRHDDKGKNIAESNEVDMTDESGGQGGVTLLFPGSTLPDPKVEKELEKDRKKGTKEQERKKARH